MSRAYDFTVVGVITIISVVIHLMGIELFAPGTELYSLATDGTQAMKGTQRAQLWWQIIAIWAPLGSTGAIMVWAGIREYRRTIQTTASRAR